MGIVSNKRTDTNTVELEIVVGAQELRDAAGQVFKRKVKNITVPGFRKGKAPRQIIEKMYGEYIFLEDAAKDLYPGAYESALEETGLEPVSRADVEIISVDKDSGLTFRATFTVKPQVEVGEYKGIEAEKPVYAVSDADVEADINRMRERGARIITAEDRSAKMGDTAVIDFEGFLDGVAFEGGKGENHPLELGSNSFIEGFEEQVAGHAVGDEFEVNVSFPEKYHAENLAGKPAVFKVKLHEIKEKQLPELDDEFAKDVSEFDTLEELRADVRKRMSEARNRRSDSELEGNLMDKVISGVTGDIPEVMYENKIDDMLRDFEYRISSQGMRLEQYLQYSGLDAESLRGSFREQAERQVKSRLALEAIAAKEGLAATAEDIEAEYLKLAEDYKMEADKIKAILKEKDVAGDLSCAKAMELIKENAVITEKPVEKAAGTDEDGGEEAE